jgi:putative MFS transporter
MDGLKTQASQGVSQLNKERVAGAPVGSKGGTAFHHTVVFWLGIVMLVAGVLIHLPDYLQYSHFRDMLERTGPMPISGIMIAGMVLIALGICFAAYGLFPRRGKSGERPLTSAQGGFYLRFMDDHPMTPAQWRTAAALVVALIVDVMKPATIGFILPGAKAEYHLSSLQIAMWPVVALTGTVVGSIVWGALADRVGRRSAILLASLLFMGTAICGAMPNYMLNLLMCFFMGISAGGMLPIEFALFSETMPARKRGFLLVLTGGIGIAGGYLVASGAAATLEPWFGSWRILWFLGLPTGLLVILMRSFIPESPRFLLAQGRVEEARQTMASFGVVVEQQQTGAAVAVTPAASPRGGMSQLVRGPYLAQTIALVLLGVSWGLVNWGFITWLPTMLRTAGLQPGIANRILALSALIAIPGAVLAACLYGWWSSKKTMVLFAAAVVAILAGFAVLNTSVAAHLWVFLLLMVGLLTATTGIISMLMPYSAEVYATAFRGKGTGVVAASTKVAGIFGPTLTVAVISLWPGLIGPALLAAIPMAIAALAFAWKGIETRARRLEEIHTTSPASVGSTPAQLADDSAARRVPQRAVNVKEPRGHKKHEVVIIGGGPGGAASAMFLAREGVQALIVEHETFPRYHIGESLTGAGGKVLRDLGLDAEMYRQKHPNKQGVKVYGQSWRDTWFVPVTGRDAGWKLFDWDTWQVRRSEFDKMMLDEAVARGATLIPGKATKPLRNDDGSVRGVQVRMPGGSLMDIESEVLLDCSGQATFLANAGVTGPKYLGNYDKQIAVFAQVAGTIRDNSGTRDTHKDNTLIFYQKKFRWSWFVPLDEEVVSVGVVIPAAYFIGKKESKKDFLTRELQELHPELKRRIPEVKLAGDIHVIPNYSYQVRRFCGKGFICIGDAHRFIDPIFSFGLTVAMREAQFVAPAVKAYLEGAHRDATNPFVEHQLFCEKGIDVLEDGIDLFWEQPLTFTQFVHHYFQEDMKDMFDGRIYERQPSPAVLSIRKTLRREVERERSYSDGDSYSVPIGSRFHPERDPLWQTNSPIQSTNEWTAPR